MVIGAEIGFDLPQVGRELKIVSNIFLRLIKTIIAPLIFATLVVGIAGHANLKQVGRMGWKSLLYFEVATTIALFIGLFAINISKAGVGIELPPTPAHEITEVPAPAGWQETILHIFPENIAKSIADGQVLQIVVFSILFAIGLAMVKEPYKRNMLNFCESLSEVMFKFTGVVMYLAPFAVGAAIAYTVSNMGFGILANLFKLLATLYVALIAFVLLVFLPVALLIRLPIKRFINAIAEPATIAFSTTSSEAALPKALEQMEKLGVPPKIAAFVLPAGYSFNLDGSYPVPFIGHGLCCPGCRDIANLWGTAGDPVFPHAYHQRNCRGSPGLPGDTAGHCIHLRTARGAHIYYPRYRRTNGYGPNHCKPCGELPGFLRDCPVGRGGYLLAGLPD